MKKSPSISAIIIAKNEESMIANCIDTVAWCDEVLLINNNSTDGTTQLARNMGVRVVDFHSDSFAKIRTEALLKAKTDWIFYIDADERVTPKLSQEILVNIETAEVPVLKIKRKNMMYGKYFNHGGWQNDWIERVFLRSSLTGWKGVVHESPLYKGEVKKLHHELIHLTHRNTQSNFIKSAQWTKKEAKLLFKAKTKKVTLVTLFRKSTMEFLRRTIIFGARKDGMEGLIESLVQGMNKFLVYLQLWELQQKPSLEEKYTAEEKRIANLWKKTK
ncbi:MAG: glycosyltransferase family 2 protein [Patescibacteria group bacterium]